MYKGVSRGDIFDVMETSLDEFYNYAKKKVRGNSVLVDEVVGLKNKDISKIFEIFYRGFVGTRWDNILDREFYIDRLVYEKRGLGSLCVFRNEVSGLPS